MIIYERKCNQCGKNYKGSGKFFCSLSCAYKGRKNDITGLKLGWGWGKGKKFPERSGERHPLWGKERPLFVRDKISLSRKESGVAAGELNPNWKGGITKVKASIRTCEKYRKWCLSIFRRDNFSCVDCGDNRGGNLNAHHIKSVSLILKENNIITLDSALLCEELWDINNGKTLCIDCHKKTDNYGRKLLFKKDYSIIKI